jgi:chorismate mutase
VDVVAKAIKYYIVAADALPEIFVKVAEAKRMMQTGEVETVGEATRRAGISRSAFYKYKDSVQPFNDMKAEHIITFYAMLKDTSGVLSRVLSIFAASGANILTINQSIPTNGCAAVTISAETSDMQETLEELMLQVLKLAGVVKFEILAG